MKSWVGTEVTHLTFHSFRVSDRLAGQLTPRTMVDMNFPTKWLGGHLWVVLSMDKVRTRVMSDPLLLSRTDNIIKIATCYVVLESNSPEIPLVPIIAHKHPNMEVNTAKVLIL